MEARAMRATMAALHIDGTSLMREQQAARRQDRK